MACSSWVSALPRTFSGRACSSFSTMKCAGLPFIGGEASGSFFCCTPMTACIAIVPANPASDPRANRTFSVSPFFMFQTSTPAGQIEIGLSPRKAKLLCAREKLQAPTAKLQKNTNFQAPRQRWLSFEDWILVFFWSLAVGAWSFLIDSIAAVRFTHIRPGGVNERSPTSIVVTHCECDSADADLFSIVLNISPASGFDCQRQHRCHPMKFTNEVEIIIKDTHRGLWYEDGVLIKVVEAGRYKISNREGIFGRKKPLVELVLVDMRERDLTIKGQEILTADKVALRVSIIVQFRVVDPKLALHAVEKYEDRLYSDVQLAARRSLASMTLEDILTNRNRLSEDILRDVKGTAASYGVTIHRADVKDLVFPGNLQEIMNKVLAAERMSQVQLVEARTKADVQKIETQAAAETQRSQAAARSNAQRLEAQGATEVQRLQTEAEIRRLQERERTAQAYTQHPALLRMLELETLRYLARNANARIYIGFDKHAGVNGPAAAE